MMQGITTLPGAQQGQQAPGQAAPFQAMPQQQPQTPQAVTGSLERMPPQQLLQMFANPADKTPKWAVVTAYAKAIEQQRLMDAARGQSAMQQGQMQAQQPPVAAQVMSQPVGIAQFSSGGAVAFADGGLSVGYDRNYNDARRFGIDLSPYDAPEVRAEKLERVQRMREFEAQQQAGGRAEIPNEFAIANTMAGYRDPRRARLDVPYVPPTAAPSGIAAAAAPLRANRPPAGIATAASVQPPAPPVPAKPDKLSQIEEEYETGSKGLQALLQRQGQVDPELARLRQAAYESAQGITERRERERTAALEAAQKAAGAPLLENQEALLRMAASLGGAKRFGEGLSRVAGAAGEVRGEQRKALEAAQKVSREEQNAIDQLNQALAEKRVADRSGDVDRQRQAEIAVEQAKMNLTDKRLGVQKERGTEEDRAEQRKIAREQIAAQLQAARITAAAREAGMADPRKIYDTIIDNVQKEYDAWAKSVEGVRSTPEQKAAKRQELLQQQIRIASATGVKGLEGLLAAGAAVPAAARVVDFSSIK